MTIIPISPISIYMGSLLFKIKVLLHRIQCWNRILIYLNVAIFTKRNRDCECRAFVRYAVYINFPIIDINYMFDNSQPQTGSTCISAARFVNPKKSFKDPWNNIMVYTNPIVQNLDAQIFIVLIYIQLHLS